MVARRSEENSAFNNKINDRLLDLKDFAEEDSISPNDNSEKLALEFIEIVRNIVYTDKRELFVPCIFLLNNGDYRIAWDENNIWIALQFIDNKTIQFVYFDNEYKTSGQQHPDWIQEHIILPHRLDISHLI